MASLVVEVAWQRGTQDFLDRRYSRQHLLRFDGGAIVPGSSSPAVVPLPMSDPAAVDPEEAFVAALSSCHMLWFLDIAAGRQYCVDGYLDRAEGVLGKNAAGKLAMTRVTLRPEVRFAGARRPDREELFAMHQQAHEACFIANSVNSELRCEPVLSNG